MATNRGRRKDPLTGPNLREGHAPFLWGKDLAKVKKGFVWGICHDQLKNFKGVTIGAMKGECLEGRNLAS